MLPSKVWPYTHVYKDRWNTVWIKASSKIVKHYKSDLFVLDDPLFNGQFFVDVLLNLWRDDSWRRGSLVLNDEMLWILFVLFQKHEKPAFLDPQSLLDVLSIDLVPKIPFKKFFKLIGRKPLVQLRNNLKPRF